MPVAIIMPMLAVMLVKVTATVTIINNGGDNDDASPRDDCENSRRVMSHAPPSATGDRQWAKMMLRYAK